MHIVGRVRVLALIRLPLGCGESGHLSLVVMDTTGLKTVICVFPICLPAALYRVFGMKLFGI